MNIFLNVFEEGGALIEDQPAGDRSLVLDLPERERKTILSLLSLNSFEVSLALAALVAAGERLRGATARPAGR